MKFGRCVWIWLAAAAVCVAAESGISQNAPRLASAAMLQLRESFQRARAPHDNELLGTWMLIRDVSTEEFLTGMQGPDHLLFDPNGIRRDPQTSGANSAEKPFEWTL